MSQEEEKRERLKKLFDMLYIDSYAEQIQETVCENKKVGSEKIEEMIEEYENTIRTVIEEGGELPLSPPAVHNYRNRS